MEDLRKFPNDRWVFFWDEDLAIPGALKTLTKEDVKYGVVITLPFRLRLLNPVMFTIHDVSHEMEIIVFNPLTVSPIHIPPDPRLPIKTHSGYFTDVAILSHKPGITRQDLQTAQNWTKDVP